MRRLVVTIIVISLVASALATLGSVEGDHAADRQIRGMAAVQREVDSTPAPPSAFRITPTLYCLLYRRGANPFALELCYDRTGRLEQTIDRRNFVSPTFWDLEYDPARAHHEISPRKLAEELRRMGAFRHLVVPVGVLPTGIGDVGPQLSRVKHPRSSS
jgi:hypothetical protein